MKTLQLALLIFIPIYCFWVTPNPAEAQTVQASLYAPRLWFMLGLVGFGSLWAIGLAGQGLTIPQYVKAQIKAPGLMTVLTLLYAAWVIMSAMFSNMPMVAWLGQIHAQFGALMILCCLGAAALYANVRLPEQWVIRVLAICTLVMAALAIIEAIGFRPLISLVHSSRMVYPAGTVGLRQHLAGWFSIFALLPVFFYRERSRDVWFWLWLAAGLVGTALCTNSAATLGVLIGLGLWNITNFRKDWKIPIGVTVAFVGLVLLLPLAARHASQVLGHSDASFKDYRSTSTLTTRLYLWEAGFRGAQQKPIFGWGDETFSFQLPNLLSEAKLNDLYRIELGLPEGTKFIKIGFDNFYIKPKSGQREYFNIFYVEPHGLIFNEMYARGFIGLLLLALVLVHQGYRLLKAAPHSIVSLMPYGIYMMFTFNVVTVTPLFFIVVGTLISSLAKPINNTGSQISNPSTIPARRHDRGA